MACKQISSIAMSSQYIVCLLYVKIKQKQKQINETFVCSLQLFWITDEYFIWGSTWLLERNQYKTLCSTLNMNVKQAAYPICSALSHVKCEQHKQQMHFSF